jgi:hypothetical protein
MKTYSADIPAYVTLRFEARDEAHAREILKGFETYGVDLGSNEFEIEKGIMLSPGITLYPQDMGTTQLFWQDE